MSGVILLVCAIALAVQGLNFGIDFEGGTRITAPLERAASVDEVRDALGGIGLGDAEIQTVDNPELGENVVQISAEELGPDEAGEAEDILDERFGLADNVSIESIGASFGQSVADNAISAIIASLVIISIYITLRFQWKFAVPVLIALAHDLLITGGVYALLGREVTASTVAALLTILGFSLYDTIVVFDRVRENIPRMPNAAFSQIYNRSMSEVIIRSLATSFCAGLPILALMLFGGETLQDFAFALLVGTLSGTYSSVFIAGPVLTHWKEREPVYKARETRIRSQFGGVVPAYAVATAGAPVDVAPAEPRRGRSRLTAPADPARGVSSEEFEEMVARPRRRVEDAPSRRRRSRPPPEAARRAGAARGRGRPRTRTAATSRRSRRTAATGGRADGRARVGDGRDRALALRDLRARSLLVGDRRRVRGRRGRRVRVRLPDPRARPCRGRTTRTSLNAVEAVPGARDRDGRRVLDRAPPGAPAPGADLRWRPRFRSRFGSARPLWASRLRGRCRPFVSGSARDVSRVRSRRLVTRADFVAVGASRRFRLVAAIRCGDRGPPRDPLHRSALRLRRRRAAGAPRSASRTCSPRC